jgi:hypothetical protein
MKDFLHSYGRVNLSPALQREKVNLISRLISKIINHFQLGREVCVATAHTIDQCKEQSFTEQLFDSSAFRRHMCSAGGIHGLTSRTLRATEEMK